MKRFSVIVPVYNRLDELSVAVESVFAQRMSDFELIVVDDGSTEDVATALASYGQRLQVLHQQNAGQAAARNLGASRACGEYLAFLDSDDSWLPWTLDVFDRLLKKWNEPAMILGTRSHFEHESEIAEIPEGKDKSKLFDDLLALQRHRYTPAGSCTMVVRRDEYHRVGGFDRVRCNSEDVDLYLRLGEAPGCVRLDAPTTLAYRLHQGNVSKDLEKSVEGFDYLMRRELEGCYPGGRSRFLDRASILSFQARALSLRLASAGRLTQALGIYLRVFVMHVRLVRLRYLALGPIEMVRRWILSVGSRER